MQFTAKYTNEIAYIYAQLIAQYTAQYDEEFLYKTRKCLRTTLPTMLLH
jgi:hypothetical protein